MDEVKLNIAFLKKVADREVRKVSGYSTKRGSYEKFLGGEATAQKHIKAGFIRMEGVASLGRPSYAELTDKGREALAKAESSHGA